MGLHEEFFVRGLAATRVGAWHEKSERSQQLIKTEKTQSDLSIVPINNRFTDSNNLSWIVRGVLPFHREDVISSPGGNSPRPATLFESGVNMYCGKEGPLADDNGQLLLPNGIQNADDLHELPEGIVHRYAYATGTGTNTIGINPMQFKILPWFDELNTLWSVLKPSVPQPFWNTPWNAASIKL